MYQIVINGVCTAYLQKSYIQHFNHNIIVKLYDLVRIVISEHTTLLAHAVGRKLVLELLDGPFCVGYVVDKVLLGQILYEYVGVPGSVSFY